MEKNLQDSLSLHSSSLLEQDLMKAEIAINVARIAINAEREETERQLISSVQNSLVMKELANLLLQELILKRMALGAELEELESELASSVRDSLLLQELIKKGAAKKENLKRRLDILQKEMPLESATQTAD